MQTKYIKMEFKEDCGFPLGNLTITNDEPGKIYLKRCVRHKPFKILTYEEFRKIPDIIEYVENFEYSDVNDYVKTDLECLSCLPCETLKNKPKQVHVSLSRSCNLDCYNCFFIGQHKNKPGDKEIYFETLYKIKGHQLDLIGFTEFGEPFIFYYETLEYLKSLSTQDTKHVRFFTNGTLLSYERFDELKKTSDETGVIYKFVFSIDGITKETFEAVRIGAIFEKVIENLKYAIKIFGKDNIIISYTVKQPAMEDAPYAKSFFMKNFGIMPNMYYDLFDSDCEDFIHKAEDLDIDDRPKEY